MDAVSNFLFWTRAQGNIVFIFACALVFLTAVLLSFFPITQLWIFKLKREAEKKSYFAITYPLPTGGHAYGFVFHFYSSKLKEKLHEAVIFWGGYSRAGGLKEENFSRIDMTIPEVIIYAYLAPWLPFLSKYLGDRTRDS